MCGRRITRNIYDSLDSPKDEDKWNTQQPVHGDDFLVLADPEGQDCMKEASSKKYERRCDGMIGEGAGDRPTILNRMIAYEQGAGKVTCEADPKHPETITSQLNLTQV